MENNTNTDRKLKLPIFSYVFFGIFAFSVVLYIVAISYTPFADFFNRYVSSIIRGALASVTNIIPLSLSEIAIITLPVTLFFAIRFSLKRFTSSWQRVGVFCVSVLSIICMIFALFINAFGIAYYTSELDEKLNLEQNDVNAKELHQTALWLIEQVNLSVDEVEFEEKSSSIMPYSIREMNNILLDAYDKMSDEYSFIPRLTSYVKPIMLSEPMTYTHISGVYTFITGEANLNTNAPDYCLPYTTAHELAHQRGIAREDEANFIAFLVCTKSDDPYIRYCGYMNLCEYVLNALYVANTDMWTEAYQKLDIRARYEMYAYNEHYKKYQDNIVGDISGAINDAYLQANGTEGSKSYGLVVDLAVAYYHTNIEK